MEKATTRETGPVSVIEKVLKSKTWRGKEYAKNSAGRCTGIKRFLGQEDVTLISPKALLQTDPPKDPSFGRVSSVSSH